MQHEDYAFDPFLFYPGARLSAEIEDNKEWRESRPAQFSVPEDDLVGAVRRVLAAQAEDRAAVR